MEKKYDTLQVDKPEYENETGIIIESELDYILVSDGKREIYGYGHTLEIAIDMMLSYLEDKVDFELEQRLLHEEEKENQKYLIEINGKTILLSDLTFYQKHQLMEQEILFIKADHLTLANMKLKNIIKAIDETLDAALYPMVNVINILGEQLSKALLNIKKEKKNGR